uniref:Uncharacterized protein n=1 Tax=Rhizophora mucronata TaxID=61149 RepID=A0A2P2ML53_RHIMU
MTAHTLEKRIHQATSHKSYTRPVSLHRSWVPLLSSFTFDHDIIILHSTFVYTRTANKIPVQLQVP